MKRTLSIGFMTILLAFSISSFSTGSEKVEISCSEQDAQILVDGVLVGNGKTKVTVRKGECVNVKITKSGFVTVEKNYCNKKGDSFPEKDFIKMEIDEAYTSSITNDVANVDIVLKVNSPGLDSWKALNSVILSYFDIIELADKETSYLRTAWAVQNFNSVTVRTRCIVKSDAGGYRIKLLSEVSNPNAQRQKTDESFRQWDRVLRKYENLFTDLYARVK